MKKRFLVLALSVLMLAGTLVGCEDKGSKRHSGIIVWAAQNDLAMVTTMVNAYRAANPDVTVPMTVKVVEDDVAAGNLRADPNAAADVICVPNDNLGGLVAGNNLYEITGDHLTAIAASNQAAAVAAGKFGGKQYGFPSSAETYFLYYDKSKLTSVDTLENILTPDLGEDSFNLVVDMGAYYSAMWFFTYGCELFGANGQDKNTVTFNNANGVEAAQKIIELGANTKVENADGGAAATLFGQGKLGATISGPWSAESYRTILGNNYGVAKLPTVDGKQMKGFAGYKLYVVNSRTNHRDISMDLAAWLTNEANQETRFTTRDLLPVNTVVAAKSELFADNQTAQACKEQLAHAITMPSIPEMSNFWVAVPAYTKDLFDQKITSGDIQAKLNAMVNQIKGLS